MTDDEVVVGAVVVVARTLRVVVVVCSGAVVVVVRTVVVDDRGTVVVVARGVVVGVVVGEVVGEGEVVVVVPGATLASVGPARDSPATRVTPRATGGRSRRTVDATLTVWTTGEPRARRRVVTAAGAGR